ncbi:MAG TPA: hypothetical protein VFE22_08570 [Edaphobacter sp.]|nr:hypothetical protein [Edaphobacter sp.]
MSTRCIFCDNNSGSREHLWPKWIHERHDFGPIKMEINGSETIVRPNPELKMKTVCGVCNNGWMSGLEAENIPVIGEMLTDMPLELNENQQRLVAAWSVKTAMMSDSMKGRNASNRFYTRDECADMRLARTIPPRTLIWIGRVDGMHLALTGNDFTLNDPAGNRLATNTANTIVAGHFVTQVVTVHINQPGVTLEAIPCKIRNWNENLIQIWPIQQPIVHWPQTACFTNGGPDGIAYLMDRWRVGDETDKISV